jgi:ketosteroid isomerase-like protein
MKAALSFCFLLLFVASPGKPPGKTNAAEVRRTLSAFIQAFKNLEWDKFRSFFSDDASVFYPREFPERAEGRAEYEAGFRKVFEQIRAGRTQPPYMDIRPRGLEIRFSGETAIVSFHLDDSPGFINRRTIVLARIGQQWKIVHLHASEVRVPSANGTAH